MIGKKEDREQKEKECRGAVGDPPALYHESVVNSQNIGDREEKIGNRLEVMGDGEDGRQRAEEKRQ